jgi:2-pyrone-4,6-dicarboxylate lactonase
VHSLQVTTPGPHRTFQRPDLELPTGSVDAHVHVFGPHEKFPFAPDRKFTPEDAPLELLRQMHGTMGFSRSVLVQSACHGNDHTVLLDALERGEGAYRAVALFGEDITADEVARLAQAGFCGVRIHFAPHLGAPPTASDIRRICDLIGPFGWHLEVHTMGSGIQDFAAIYPEIPVRVVLDHMGRFDIAKGQESDEFKLVISLLQENDVWIKLSGADRVSHQLPSMADGLALGRSLFLSRPDRCVWGSDFPHPNTHGFMPWDHELVNGIATIAPTPQEREQLLVTNPGICFGFDRA